MLLVELLSKDAIALVKVPNPYPTPVSRYKISSSAFRKFCSADGLNRVLILEH